jgi:hypothetical protein
MAQTVEHLPIGLRALNFTPSTKEERGTGGGGEEKEKEGKKRRRRK